MSRLVRFFGQVLPRAILVGWAAFLLVVGATLMGSHLLTLPRPDGADPVLVAALEALRPDNAEIHAVHVMYTECGCSRRILDHLAARAPVSGVAETVLLVGREPVFEEAVQSAGFALVHTTQEALQQDYHIEAAPLLVVLDAASSVRYLGGYTARKQGPDIRDVELLAGVRDGEREAELPLFGCATSRELQRTLDPLGLRFAQALPWRP